MVGSSFQVFSLVNLKKPSYYTLLLQSLIIYIVLLVSQAHLEKLALRLRGIKQREII